MLGKILLHNICISLLCKIIINSRFFCLVRNMFNNISSSSDSTGSSKSPDIDMDTILKMKSIMDKINAKNDKPSSKLLYDLKPFLNESKQSKIDKYVKMDKMVELLPLIGGDLNTHLYSDNQALLFSLIALLF